MEALLGDIQTVLTESHCQKYILCNNPEGTLLFIPVILKLSFKNNTSPYSWDVLDLCNFILSFPFHLLHSIKN